MKDYNRIRPILEAYHQRRCDKEDHVECYKKIKEDTYKNPHVQQLEKDMTVIVDMSEIKKKYVSKDGHCEDICMNGAMACFSCELNNDCNCQEVK